MPELRIVEEALWEGVKHAAGGPGVRHGPRRGGNALNRAHRRRFLLSGLLVCGACDGGYTIMGKDRYGCAAHRSKGTCGNDRTVSRPEIEGRVLDGLKHRLLAPELFEAFARAYQEEWPVLARSDMAERVGLEGRLVAVERKIAGHGPGDRGWALPALDEGAPDAARGREDAGHGGAGGEAGADPMALHPNLPLLYRRKVEELEAVLADPELGPRRWRRSAR